MARAQNSSGGRIATVFFLGLFGVLAWFLAPFAFPVYKWMHVDFAKLAEQHREKQHASLALLSTEFTFTLAYLPRGERDPHPWAIVKMNPPWGDATADPYEDEEQFLRRCVIISDRNGGPPSQLHLGSGHYKDLYFTAKGWRLPPGSLGKTRARPVILYQASTFDKIPYAEAEMYHYAITQTKEWEQDDDWAPATP